MMSERFLAGARIMIRILISTLPNARKFIFAAALSAALIPLTSCGGGGGGGGDGDEDFVGAALVAIATSPSEIDTGDRTRVTVEIAEVHENGIAVKIRFPTGLAYIPSSAFLQVQRSSLDATPTHNLPSGNNNFLVFFFSKGAFGDNSGTLVLELEGLSSVTDGVVEVDADVDDPRVDNQAEFTVENAEFAAEDAADIAVEGSSLN